MRVALISMHTSPLAVLGGKDTGGMNVFVREIARELGRRNIAADVFTRSQGDWSLRLDPRLGPHVRVVHVTAGPDAPLPKAALHAYVPEFVRWTCRFAEEQGLRYDVIHAHYWLSGLVGEALRACWGVPLVMTFHTLAALKNMVADQDQDMESELRLRSECHLCEAATLITASTQVEKTQLVRFYGAGSSRIRILHPGVDLARFHPIEQGYAKSVIGVRPDQRVILFTGRIERLKGVDTLLRAVALLRQQRPDWDWARVVVLIIGGDPTERGRAENREMRRLHELREALRLKEQVCFLGARDQDALPYYYAAAEMLVMPSHYESFGMVALEAMACGTPVVASDVGSLSVLVQHNKTGLRVKVNDPAELAEAIALLMDDPARRRRMGRRAACFAESYSWQVVCDRLLEVYDEARRRHAQPQ